MTIRRFFFAAAFLAGFAFSATASAAQSSDIVGGWRLTSNPGDSAIFTFLSNGTYMQAEDQLPPGDPTGQNGMERGTFNWNPISGAFSSVTLVDTNGQWGLSNPMGPLTVSVNGNLMTVIDGAETSTFERVAAIPEPETYAMMLAGLGLLGFTARRRRQQVA